MTDDGSRDEELLRRALREEADRIMPSPDALARIRERTARRPFWRAPLVVGLAGGLVTATAVIAGAIVVLDTPDADNTFTGPSDSTPAPTSSPSVSEPATLGSSRPPTPSQSVPGVTSPSESVLIENVPVYYVTDTSAGPRLAREFRNVEAPDGPLVAAVKTMLATAPEDPEYEALWSSATDVRSVEVKDDVIEVDLTGTADYTGVTEEIARLATQELVYTVTAAVSASSDGSGGNLPVQVLLDGVSVEKLWGDVDMSEPVARAPQEDVRQLVQINNPAEGSDVERSFTVDGEAAVFEATLEWEVVDSDGEVVLSDFATAEECCKFAPFEFPVELEPGTYTIRVSETDPSGGAEGRAPMTDTRTVTVK
jgi:hypothetical protein